MISFLYFSFFKKSYSLTDNRALTCWCCRPIVRGMMRASLICSPQTVSRQKSFRGDKIWLSHTSRLPAGVSALKIHWPCGAPWTAGCSARRSPHGGSVSLLARPFPCSVIHGKSSSWLRFKWLLFEDGAIKMWKTTAGLVLSNLNHSYLCEIYVTGVF